MDGNALIEIARSGLTIVTPAIQSAITALITTVFLRKNTNVAELEKLKAAKFEEVINELVESGKMTYLEFYKCRNFMSVAKIADEAVRNGDSAHSEKVEFSFDWFMRLFDAVGNISNEDLQELWGKILANEINSPKTCSLRTLDMVRNISPEEAKVFTQLCKYVIRSGESYFIHPTGFYDESQGYLDCHRFMEKAKLRYPNSIMPMLETGILTSDHDLAIYLGKGDKLQMHNEKILCIIEHKGVKPKMFQQEAYFLTTSGLEIYNIVKSSSDYEPDAEYATLCFKQMKQDCKDFKISAYKILEYGDEPCCDLTDLL